jgi:hypothetical protein
MARRKHSIQRALRKAHELEHVADVGESDETPLILFAETWLWLAVVLLVVLALTLLAYRLAS